MTDLLKAVVAAMVISGPLLAATAEPASDGGLLDRAIARIDLCRAGTPPIRIRARVVTTNDAGDTVAGNYHWVWVSSGSWREEVAFPVFVEATGRSGQKTWRKRRLDFTALEIGWTYQAVHFADRLRHDRSGSASAPERKKVHGVDQSCFKLGAADNAERRWCFDVGSGDLLREEGIDDLGKAIAVTYGHWREAKGKRFPGTIAYTVDKRQRIEIKVTEFEAAHETDPATFLPPEGAEELPTCDSSITTAVPAAPIEAPAARGSAAVEARIGSDGKVKRVRIVDATSKEFAHKLAEKVAATAFKPATCDGRAIESDQLFRQAVR